MHTLPPIRSGWRWHVAGGVFTFTCLLATSGWARTQVDFSLEREIRWRVAPSFWTATPPPGATPAAPYVRPAVTPPRTPSRQEYGRTEASQQGLVLLRLPFAL